MPEIARTATCVFNHLGGCEGRLRAAHLVPKNRLRQEGVPEHRIWDPRCWRPMCGGYGYGNAGHHGAYDAKQIQLDAWPADFLEFLVEHDIGWIAERYASYVRNPR